MVPLLVVEIAPSPQANLAFAYLHPDCRTLQILCPIVHPDTRDRVLEATGWMRSSVRGDVQGSPIAPRHGLAHVTEDPGDLRPLRLQLRGYPLVVGRPRAGLRGGR